MKKAAAIGLAALALGAAVFHLHRQEPQPWTTSSEEALAEFQLGLEAEMKLYHGEAIDHFLRALELDPGFVAPMIWLASKPIGEEGKAAEARLEEVDLEEVSPREKVLVELFRLKSQGQSEQARAVLTRYLSEYPNDPFVLYERCNQLSMMPKKAEDCFRRLIAVEPNFVRAQNHLGYLAMGQGRFREAEERFRTYQYLAPDQANPHDSMGELLLILGRYEEAEQELEEALALRPDFTASYGNLIHLAISRDDWEAAEATLERAVQAGLAERSSSFLRCLIRVRRTGRTGSWEALWQEIQSCGPSQASNFAADRFRAALWTGRWEDVAAIEAARAKQVAEGARSDEYGGNPGQGFRYHLQGIRLAAEGELTRAEEALRQADRWIHYVRFGEARLKLINKLTLIDVLEAQGKDPEAQEIREQVAAVNEHFLRFEEFYSIPKPAKAGDGQRRPSPEGS